MYSDEIDLLSQSLSANMRITPVDMIEISALNQLLPANMRLIDTPTASGTSGYMHIVQSDRRIIAKVIRNISKERFEADTQIARIMDDNGIGTAIHHWIYNERLKVGILYQDRYPMDLMTYIEFASKYKHGHPWLKEYVGLLKRVASLGYLLLDLKITNAVSNTEGTIKLIDFSDKYCIKYKPTEDYDLTKVLFHSMLLAFDLQTHDVAGEDVRKLIAARFRHYDDSTAFRFIVFGKDHHIINNIVNSIRRYDMRRRSAYTRLLLYQ